MKRLSVKILFSLVVVVFLYAAFFKGFGVQISKQNLQRSPFSTTELYFSDHTNLPKKVEIGQNYSFDFTTRNLENTNFNYTYSVIFSSNNTNSTIASGNFELTDKEERKNTVNFLLSQGFGRGKITVHLQEKNQQIHFWVDESS